MPTIRRRVRESCRIYSPRRAPLRRPLRAGRGKTRRETEVTAQAVAPAYDAAGQPDSTLAIYQALLRYHDPQEPYFVAVWEGLMLRRSGELYEARAQRPAALASYKAFVDLMWDADPELQPQVRDIRLRIARLEKTERDRR